MKVAMLVSGGVDSSVALYRLKKQGIDLRAYYLKVWLEDDAKFMGSCPWAEDLRYVRDTCAYLKIPLSIIPLQQAYYRHVVQYVLTELQQGATPSPDILCNSRIKFGAFLHAIGDSFDYVASGHYAQLRQWKNTTELLCSLDNQKDQTYFLSQLTQAQLKYLLFPVGDTVKHILREEARRNALPSSERKDSQGICFLGKITYPTFIAYYLGKQAGKIIEKKTGKILGMHHGYWFYTIGQRKGLKLGGGPWYVVKKDCTENTIYVAKEEDVHSYGCDSFFLRDTNWIPYLPKDGLLQVKIRHSPEYLEAVFQSSPRPLVVLKNLSVVLPQDSTRCSIETRLAWGRKNYYCHCQNKLLYISKFSIAPMMDYTDRYFRYMMRAITQCAVLYTEMKMDASICYGNTEHELAFHTCERPLVLQIASDDRKLLMQALKRAEEYPYDAYNLNVGCPSARAQQRNIGACQMENPLRVARLVENMRAITNKPISVKHRIGIQGKDSYRDLKNFVHSITQSGVQHIIVHARVALLNGISPRSNRSIPPLRYRDVYQLKQDFPELQIEINGGISSLDEIHCHLRYVDRVMLGRSAYRNPMLLLALEQEYCRPDFSVTRKEVVQRFCEYVENNTLHVPLQVVQRHMMGLFSHKPGAKQWRILLSSRKLSFQKISEYADLLEHYSLSDQKDMEHINEGETLGIHQE